MASADSRHVPIETHKLTKAFGPVVAVNEVNLKVNSGDIYALIGPNGAGKTTLIKILVGLISPDSGKALIDCCDIVRAPVAAKTSFGYIPDHPQGYDFLTGRELLLLTGRLRLMDEDKLKRRIKELERLFPLDQRLDDQLAGYSRGNRQKVAFLQAMLETPKLLIIDEPIVGLDPVSIDIFGHTIKTHAANGNAVFMATHTLPFARQYATRFGFMNQGKITKESDITSKTDLEKEYKKLLKN